MAMAGLDIDAILQAQSSDEEQDEEAAEGEVLDADAFDRRLEEILNADDEYEEDDDGEGNSLPANPTISRRSELVLDRSKDLSQLHSPGKDAGASQSSSHLGTSSRDASSLRHGTSSGDAWVSESSLHQGTTSRDVSSLSHGTSSGDDWVSESSLHHSTSNRDALVLESSLHDRSASQSSNVYRAPISGEQFSSTLLPMSSSQASRTPNRQPRPFSSDISQFGANYGSSGGQHSTLSSYSTFDGRKIAAARPGAALTAAAAASTQASTLLLGSSTSKRPLSQDELGKDDHSSTKDVSASNALPSMQGGQNVEQVADGSNVYDEGGPLSDLLGEVETRIGSEDNHGTQLVHFDARSPVSINERVTSTSQSISVEGEDDTLLLEESLEVFVNDDDDDDDD
eukprot:c24935_g1_i1 orf=108-1301(+)